MSDLPDSQVDYWVVHHPQPMCHDFTAKPKPSDYWCANCGWSEPLHDEEDTRTAIADALRRRETRIASEPTQGPVSLDPGASGAS